MRPSLEAAGRFDPVRARERFLSGFVARDTQVIRSEGELAGFFVVRDRGDHLYLDHLYLAAAFQGQGIGGRVVRALQEEARRRGIPVRLLALNGSPAGRFYQSLGFRAVARDALDTQYEWQAGG